MSLDAYVGEPNKPLLDHCIGNITRVDAIREEFEQAVGFYPPSGVDPTAPPVRWADLKFGIICFTIRNGCHCMDIIPLGHLPQLKRELLSMPRGGDRLEVFRAQMLELCEVALKHGLPIRF